MLNGGGLHQCPEVLVDRPFPRVVRLGQAAQEHCRGGNVLTSPSELRGIGPFNWDVALGLTGVTPGVARRVMRTGRIVVCRARRRKWQLVLPPLS